MSRTSGSCGGRRGIYVDPGQCAQKNAHHRFHLFARAVCAERHHQFHRVLPLRFGADIRYHAGSVACAANGLEIRLVRRFSASRCFGRLGHARCRGPRQQSDVHQKGIPKASTHEVHSSVPRRRHAGFCVSTPGFGFRTPCFYFVFPGLAFCLTSIRGRYILPAVAAGCEKRAKENDESWTFGQTGLSADVWSGRSRLRPVEQRAARGARQAAARALPDWVYALHSRQQNRPGGPGGASQVLQPRRRAWPHVAPECQRLDEPVRPGAAGW